MLFDHDIPTHLDVEVRPALGLTAKQLLLLGGGGLAGLGALRQPHLALAPRLVDGLAPLVVALLLVFVRPSGRSLVAWGRVALLHVTGPRTAVWASARATSTPPSRGASARPPHLALAGYLPSGAAAPAPAPHPPQRYPRHPATQAQPFVPREMADGIVTFSDGRHCAVLECSGANTTLLDADALRAVHAAYHAFLVGLPWPLQLLVWASPVDLRAFRAAREGRLAGLPPALREVESADIAFMEREARRVGLLDHRLFVVIPAPGRAGRTVPNDSLLTALRARLRPAAPAYSDNAVAADLDERSERIIAELAAGVHAWRLSTDELRALWYRLLAPRSARLQPLDPGHTDPLARPTVSFSTDGTGSTGGTGAEEEDDA